MAISLHGIPNWLVQALEYTLVIPAKKSISRRRLELSPIGKNLKRVISKL
ncbi:MAG: hypothetical protein AB8B35_04765 [Prochlorococcus sp.]